MRFRSANNADFFYLLPVVLIMLALTACGSDPDSLLPTDTSSTITASPAPTATDTPTPTPTATPTPSPTPGLGLDELILTPDMMMRDVQLDRAMEAYEELAILYPNRALPRLQQSAIEQRVGNFDSALKYLYLAVEAEPDNLDAWRKLALLLDQQGMYPELIDAYTQMLEASDDDAAILIARASVYARLGETESAIADLQAAQTLDTTRDYGWRQVAAAASDNRQYDIAIEIAGAGLESNPDNGGLLLIRALAYLSLDSPAAALPDLNTILDLNERNATALHWRGRIYAEQGDLEKAVEDLQAAAEWGSLSGVAGMTEAFDAMADAADVLARYDVDEAFTYLASQVFVYGSRDPLMVGYARIDWRRGSTGLALSRLDGLIRDEYIPAYYWRAQILAEEGEEQDALSDLEAYLAKYHSGPEAEAARRLYLALGGDEEDLP